VSKGVRIGTKQCFLEYLSTEYIFYVKMFSKLRVRDTKFAEATHRNNMQYVQITTRYEMRRMLSGTSKMTLIISY
jgi:hypothetical protein